MSRPYLVLEIIGTFFIIISIFLTLSPHFKRIPEEAKIAAVKNSLMAVNDAFAMYFTTFNTYPQEEEIYNFTTLKRVLSPYLKREENLYFFDFISYKSDNTNYELVIMVEGKVLKLTPEGIRENEE